MPYNCQPCDKFPGHTNAAALIWSHFGSLCLLSHCYTHFDQLLINNSKGFGEFNFWHRPTALITSLFTLMVFQGVLNDHKATRSCTFQLYTLSGFMKNLGRPPRPVMKWPLYCGYYSFNDNKH